MAAFTPEEVEHCKASMSKPAPQQALALIASGRLVVELSDDRRNVILDSIDGRKVRDEDYPGEDRKCGLSGAWPLYRAGMIDTFGVVTPEGRAFLAALPLTESKPHD